jgi:hypothetical protein
MRMNVEKKLTDEEVKKLKEAKERAVKSGKIVRK